MVYELAPRPDSYETHVKEVMRRDREEKIDRYRLAGLCGAMSGFAYSGAVLFGKRVLDEAGYGATPDRITMGVATGIFALFGTRLGVFARQALRRSPDSNTEPTTEELALTALIASEETDNEHPGIDLTGDTVGSYEDLRVQQYAHELRKETRAAYGKVLIQNGLDPAVLDSDRPGAITT